MNLNKEQIQKFKEIYKKIFKEDISDKKAYVEGLKVIDLVKFLYNENGELK